MGQLLQFIDDFPIWVGQPQCQGQVGVSGFLDCVDLPRPMRTSLWFMKGHLTVLQARIAGLLVLVYHVRLDRFQVRVPAEA